jgi:hypothetical protein
MAIDFMTTYAEPARKPVTATRYSRRKAPIAALLGTAIAAGLQFSAIVPAQAAPSPSSVALWTMSPDPDALTMQRSIVMTTGLVHSEGGLHIKKNKGRLTGGTEYGGEYSTQATNIRVQPAAHKITTGQGNPTTGPVGRARSQPVRTRPSTPRSARAGTGRPIRRPPSQASFMFPAGFPSPVESSAPSAPPSWLKAESWSGRRS